MQRVLVVEDWLALASYVRALLEYSGYTVIGPASTMADALHLAGTAAIDAAVLDLDVRGEEVFPVAYKLRERRKPFVFVSGVARRITIPRDLRNAPLLAKPFDADRLVESLKSLLASQNAERSSQPAQSDGG